MTEALSLGLMDVYLIDRCSLLLWRRSVKSKPAAPAAVPVFSLLRLSRFLLFGFLVIAEQLMHVNQFKG